MCSILIVGDSFAADYNQDKYSWHHQLSTSHDVTNLAEAGVGEYKILKQLQSGTMDQYDQIVISHTSPSRIHTRYPIHKSDGYHKNCDLIISDVEYYSDTTPAMRCAKDWFKFHYDEIYQQDIYGLIRHRINTLVGQIGIHICFMPIAMELSFESNVIDFSSVWANYPGNINHLSIQGNHRVHDMLVDRIL